MLTPSRLSRALRWEVLVGDRLRRVGLESLRRKILVFALLAVLIPSLSTAWMSYVQNRRSLSAKVAEGLDRSSAQAERALDLWIKERLYDARVYTGSYEVTENLGLSARAGQTLSRLNDYLRSVRTRSLGFVELQVTTPQGRVVASSAPEAATFHLPDSWLGDVQQDKPVIGTPFWDADARGPVVPIAVPVKSNDGRVLGALTAKLAFSPDSIFRGAVPEPSGALYVVNAAYGVIIGSDSTSAALMDSRFDSTIVREMLARNPAPASFHSPQQRIQVVGTAQAVRFGWYVVAQLPEREAFAQVRHLRNVTVLTVLGLLIVVGLMGYVLAQLIIRPLNRLTQGATEVAAGNLDVDLKAVGGGELGSLVDVFNGMVEQLRRNRAELDANNELLRTKNEELEHLAITDALTGLSNRRHLIAVLTRETLRARRHESHFAVLMLDVDQFKRYNDTFGHQAGDDVLVRVAVVLGQTVREGVDVAARYGGEEFLVLLPETRIDEAERAAERIRSFIENEFWGPDEPRQVTISIGVAAYPADGETPETLIASADAAMYRAKQRGRNRVERAAREKPQAKTGA